MALRLEQCSDQELMLLMAIATLAQGLPEGLEFYTRVLGEMREQFFKIGSRTRERPIRTVIDGHQPKATAAWTWRRPEDECSA